MAFSNDLRQAVRALGASTGFTAVIVATLAAGITISTSAIAIFSAYLLHGLPYPGADRLYSVRYATPGQDGPRGLSALDWRSLDDVIEHPVAWDLDVFYLLGGEQAEPVPGAWVTPGFLEALGVHPALGRGLDAQAFAAGASNDALISHRLWTSRFAADPNVIGSTFMAYVSDRPEEVERFTIAGVLPQGFWHINSYTEVFAPLRADTYPYMVRLKPGVTADEAASRITALVTAGAREVPPGWRASVVSTHAAYVEQVRPALRAVAIAALLVLGVACANVAGLLLVRAVRRQREVAIRTALGAGRGAIARMLLAEGLVIGVIATLLAALAAAFLLDWVGPLVEQQLARRPPGGPRALRFDVLTLSLTAVAGMVTALTCSLAPLAAAARTGTIASNAQAHGRSATETRRSRRMRTLLVSVEVAASLALLGGTALMLRSVHAQVHTELGFAGETVLQGSVTLRPSQYPAADDRVAVFDRIVGQVGSIPGVESVALTTSWPVQQPRQDVVTAHASGAPISTRAAIHSVSAAYFAALEIPMAAGRDFDGRDRPGDEPVAVISETLARRLYPARTAVGDRLAVPRLGSDGESLLVSHLVVGVAEDVRQGPLDEDLADVYVPLLQAPGRFAVVLVRTPGPPIAWEAPLRGAFRHVDPEIAVHGIRPFQATIDALTAGPRFLSALLAVLGAVCAALTLVGVYGIIAYAVRQREREVAVRLAIGADRARIMRLFLGEGSRILVAGLAVGVPGALLAGRLLESQLAGVHFYDPIALATAVVGFALATLLAVWWPARRAAATDPAIALRVE